MIICSTNDLRCQVRRICLQKQLIQWNNLQRFTQLLCFLIRNITTKTNIQISEFCIQHSEFFRSISSTMEVDSQIRIIFQNNKSLIKSISRMNNQRQSGLTSKFAMLDKQLFLSFQRFESVRIMKVNSGLPDSDHILFIVRI